MPNDARVEPTIGDLLELLVGPPERTEMDLVRILGVGVWPLRARMEDLRRRRLVAGPFLNSSGATWILEFATLAQAGAAARRSGLDLGSSIVVQETMWASLKNEWNRTRAGGAAGTPRALPSLAQPAPKRTSHDS